MKTKRINGLQLERMIQNGLANLVRSESKLNSLNVFPVADGDTGTNMHVTLGRGVASAKSYAAAGVYMKSLTDQMLLSARGNSGVILSQLFRGFYRALARTSWVGVGEMRNALIVGYKTAYESVVHPVEGTILTVAREGIEHIKTQIDRNTTIESLLAMYVAEMRKSLAQTPELLPALKSAGVVDSGAMGYIEIVDGMLKYMYGEMIELEEETVATTTPGAQNLDFSLFNENSVFEVGYCVEFILQLMKGENYLQNFRLRRFIDDLGDFGESIVAIQDESRVKVHVHTLKPPKVLALAQEYGELLTCKVENMQIQHNEQEVKKASVNPKKDFAIVSMADTAKMKAVLMDLGSDYVICGGPGMNASVQDFLDAYTTVNADTIMVLPNDANSIFSARQAAEMFDKSKVIILETKSVPQGYFTLAMDANDSDDVPYRIRQLKGAVNDATALFTTEASKDYQNEMLTCKKGDIIALIEDEVVCTASDYIEAFVQGLSNIEEIDFKECCIIFRGAETIGADESILEDAIYQVYPDLEVQFIDGESRLYRWMAAIV